MFKYKNATKMRLKRDHENRNQITSCQNRNFGLDKQKNH